MNFWELVFDLLCFSGQANWDFPFVREHPVQSWRRKGQCQNQTAPTHILLCKDNLGSKSQVSMHLLVSYRARLESFHLSRPISGEWCCHYLWKAARRASMHFLALNCMALIKFLFLPKLHYNNDLMAFRSEIYRKITFCEIDHFDLFPLGTSANA